MDNIFDIKFSFEKKVRDEVITKFSNKQGGDYNVFAYHWQCFAWAAVIGFLRNEKRPLAPPIADKPFSLSTMKNNDGEKVAQALICMSIAKAGSLDIMKNPNDAINLINEYANGGFYHILKLMENGENSFNDLEKVKQEIFSRDYANSEFAQLTQPAKENIIHDDKSNDVGKDAIPTAEFTVPNASMTAQRKSHRWSLKQEKELVDYYQAGMTIDQLALLFEKSEDSIKEKLVQKGVVI